MSPDRPLIDVAQDHRQRLRERLRAEWILGTEFVVFALRWDAVPATVAGLPSLAGLSSTR